MRNCTGSSACRAYGRNDNRDELTCFVPQPNHPIGIGDASRDHEIEPELRLISLLFDDA